MNKFNLDVPDDFLLLGRVIRPHGLKGLLKIQSYAGEASSFLNAGRVYLKTNEGPYHPYPVRSIRPIQKGFLLELEGITLMDEAEECRGAEIFVKKEALRREQGEFFWAELLGVRVYVNTGEYLGSLVRIIPTAGHDLYVVKDGEREVFVPAIHEVVREVDLEKGNMTIMPIEGLLED